MGGLAGEGPQWYLLNVELGQGPVLPGFKHSNADPSYRKKLAQVKRDQRIGVGRQVLPLK